MGVLDPQRFSTAVVGKRRLTKQDKKFDGQHWHLFTDQIYVQAIGWVAVYTHTESATSAQRALIVAACRRAWALGTR